MPAGRADAYLLCATPRSGSTLLCGLLRSTGVAGVPESYFREPDAQRWADRWQLDRGDDGSFSCREFVRAAVREGSTVNGVFGGRVMWGSMEPLVSRLRAAPGSAADAGPAAACGRDAAAGAAGPAETDLDVLVRAFGRTVFVHLRRRDTVAQAVSWARSEQSGFWHPGDPAPTATPVFDAALVDGLVRTIDAHEARWTAWFAAAGVTPHEVTYEDLVADLAGVTTGILDLLGVVPPAGWRARPRDRRQADATSRQWTERYLAWRQAH